MAVEAQYPSNAFRWAFSACIKVFFLTFNSREEIIDLILVLTIFRTRNGVFEDQSANLLPRAYTNLGMLP